MKVKLIGYTPFGLNIAYTSARTCYKEGSPIDAWFEHEVTVKQMYALLNECFKSGHHSVFEHINFTFAIEGISRACSHQLIRHRHCSFSQQSQRYVKFDKPKFYEPNGILCNREANSIYNNFLNFAVETYNKLIELEVRPEDARCVLPNATLTNITMTLNLRELIHICGLRLCSRAQKEIRELIQLMVKEVLASEYHWCKEYLQPKCEITGYCTEHKSCGRKNKLY